MADEPIRVLLVEDSPGDARLAEIYLSQAPAATYRLTHCDRLGDGLERLAEDDFDIILLDLTLPDSSGIGTFERAYAAARDVPIVVMTGHDDSELALRAVREGAQDYLVKNHVDAALLNRAVRYAIERKNYEEALRVSEERYALAISGANDGLWDWDLTQDRIHYSTRWKEMIGYDEDELSVYPEEWFSRVHPDELARLKQEISDHLSGRSLHFKHEHRMRHRDGSYRWTLSRGIAVRGASGKPRRMAGSLTDIHSRKMTEQQLLHDAMHDALTDLPNWALFMDRLGVAIAQCKRREEHQFAVLFLDLDRFKNVNDSLGHAVGDLLLIGIARRFRAFLRPGDTVARLGGDEFAILADAIESPSDATRIAERINEELGRPFDLQGHEVFTSASIGLALSSTGYDRPEEVLRDADTAMYRAKSLGKARHAIFDQEMHRRAVELLSLETDLRRAVTRDEFRVHYQPIVALSTGVLEGFEALVRWQHPVKGLVHPEAFISVAEETGLIVPLGWNVLHEACSQTSAWQKRFPTGEHLTVSVNLSGKQFRQPELVDRIREILDDSSLEPSRLCLEITESMIMENAESAVARMRQLRDVGVELHIDDFGTGYSSLSYLHRLPTHTIKIDRSFVRRMSERNGKSQIVGTIVTLARNLGMRVSAEGLETADQLAKLRQLECEYGQGFFFSKPLDHGDAGRLIASQPRW
jgi:diguanylate cyclase (GGDEF)-like protein/PAS domain S-box-containing protein